MKIFFSQFNSFRKKRIMFISLSVIITSGLTFSQISAEDSLFQQANYYLSIGYYESAINSFNKLIEMNSNSALAYSSLGYIFQIQGKPKKAIEMYKKRIEIDSTMLLIFMNLGNAYIDAGELNSAIEAHKFLIAKDSLVSGYYVNLGDAYLQNKDTTNGEICFLKAIDLNKYATLAHVNLAVVYVSQKKYKEAIDELFLVRNLDDWYPNLQLRLAYVCTKAESEFEKWVEREPNNSEAHYYYAFSLWYTDERGDAINELEKAIKLNDKIEKYFLTRAIWLNNEEEYDETIKDCKRCLDLNPDNWMCHNRLGLSYISLKRKDISKALIHCKRAVEIAPMAIDPQLKLGQVYIVNQQYSNAVESLNKALDNLLDSGVKNPEVYFNLARAYYLSGDYENAMKHAIIAKNMNFAEQSVKKDLEPYLNRLINNIQREVNQKR
jgi:tetratricopeptide (TPR) repeat protein